SVSKSSTSFDVYFVVDVVGNVINGLDHTILFMPGWNSFVAPTGYEETPLQESEFSTDFEKAAVDEDDDVELWLIKVPHDFPITNLDHFEIPIASSTSGKPLTQIEIVAPSQPQARTSKGKAKQGPSELMFELHEVKVGQAGGNGGEVGEMAEMKCLLPDKKSGQLRLSTKPFSRYLNLIPKVNIPSQDELKSAGEVVRSAPYIARLHPEDMKVQYEPFGSSTEGPALKESLERYPELGQKKKRKAAETPTKGDGEAKKKKTKNA
ncbi:hypothetical protein HDU76_009321, partial [Blyttiomyces sp. JEL0837]